DRRAMGQDRTAAPTAAARVEGRPSVDWQSGGHRRDPLDLENRRAVVRSARGVPQSGHVLASVETLGRGWDVAPPLAHVHRRTRRARAVAVGNGVHRWHLCPGEKGGPDIGPTKRGKGSKCMVLVERQGLPVGITIASASPGEITLLDATLKSRVLPHRRHPRHLIGDVAYDSDKHRAALLKRHIRLISPYPKNRVNLTHKDGRRHRRYRRRWIVERTIAWLGAFRRLVVRYER